MKRNLLILLVMILMASVTLGAAGGRGVRFEGIITAIDAEAMTITVNSTTVEVNSNTLICLTPSPCTPGVFGDLELGQRVRVTAVLHGDILLAKKIVVH